MKKQFLTVLFMCSLSLSLFSQTRQLVIAGIPEEPNRWTDASGKFKGIDVDVVDYIFKELGISYKIILEDSSTRLEANWKKADSPYDMVFTYSKKPEREEYLIYAEESHIDFSWNFFCRKGEKNKFTFESYNDLKGVKIGATQGISYTKEFWDAHKNGILTLDLVVTNDIQLEKLIRGRFDLVPLNTQATLYELKTKNLSSQVEYLDKPLKSSSYYNTFVKASKYPNLQEVIAGYNRVLKRMKKDGTLKKLLSEYGL